MFLFSFRFKMVTIHDGRSSSGMGGGGLRDSGLNEGDVCEIITAEILRFMTEYFPDVINLVGDQFISVMYEHFRAM